MTRIGETSAKAIQVELPPGSCRRIRSAIADRMATPAMSHESGMEVVTAKKVSALLRTPNPTSMSAPGQRNRPRPIADPAAIQAIIGIRAHNNARTGLPNIDAIHVETAMTNDQFA